MKRVLRGMTANGGCNVTEATADALYMQIASALGTGSSRTATKYRPTQRIPAMKMFRASVEPLFLKGYDVQIEQCSIGTLIKPGYSPSGEYPSSSKHMWCKSWGEARQWILDNFDARIRAKKQTLDGLKSKRREVNQWANPGEGEG